VCDEGLPLRALVIVNDRRKGKKVAREEGEREREGRKEGRKEGGREGGWEGLT